MQPLIDTHCHLDAEAFHNDFSEVIERAQSSGIAHILTIGITLETSQAAVVIANRYPKLVSAVIGIQPNYAAEAKAGDWDQIVELARHPRVVGIGETGLDKYWDFAPLDIQVDYFERHLALSEAVGKPFVIHCREAENEVLDVLTRYAQGRQLSGLMHSFCGSADVAQKCIELGLHISFAGMVTFRKNDSLRATARTIPRDRILVETDAPYLAPHPNRGKRNEPAWVRFTADCLAAEFNMPPDEFAQVTVENARRLFRLPG